MSLEDDFHNGFSPENSKNGHQSLGHNITDDFDDDEEEEDEEEEGREFNSKDDLDPDYEGDGNEEDGEEEEEEEEEEGEEEEEFMEGEDEDEEEIKDESYGENEEYRQNYDDVADITPIYPSSKSSTKASSNAKASSSSSSAAGGGGATAMSTTEWTLPPTMPTMPAIVADSRETSAEPDSFPLTTDAERLAYIEYYLEQNKPKERHFKCKLCFDKAFLNCYKVGQFVGFDLGSLITDDLWIVIGVLVIGDY